MGHQLKGYSNRRHPQTIVATTCRHNNYHALRAELKKSFQISTFRFISYLFLSRSDCIFCSARPARHRSRSGEAGGSAEQNVCCCLRLSAV